MTDSFRFAGHRRPPILAMAALALAGSLWGTGFLFGKIALREMSVSISVALRFFFGSVVLLPLLFRRVRGFHPRDFWTMVLASVVGIPVQFLVQFKGLALTNVSHASLMVSSLPVLLALTSAVFLGEKLKRFEWAVLGMSTIGAVLISLSKNRGAPHASAKGDALVILSMIAAVILTVLTKKLVAIYDPLYVTSSMIVCGTIFLWVWMIAFDHPRFIFSTGTWLAVAAQGVMATAMAYLLWNWGMARVPAARAGIFSTWSRSLGLFLRSLSCMKDLAGVPCSEEP